MNKYVFKPDRFSSHSLLLQEFDDIGNGRYVLDVGCGQGHLSRILANRGYQVIGLDKDRASLRHAAHWCCEVIEADIENWIDIRLWQRFDYILLADVVEHLSDPLSVVRRLLALLNNKGIVVISVPNISHIYMRLMLLCGKWNYTERGILDCTHLRFFTRASLLRLLDDAGISIQRLRSASIPWSILLNSAPNWLLNILESIDHFAVRLRPTLCTYQWIVSGTKKLSR